MRKIKDEITAVQLESEQLVITSKRIKEEREVLRIKNADLTEIAQRVPILEREIEVLKGNLTETHEALRNTRAAEKSLQKDLQLSKAEVKELKENRDEIAQELLYNQQENKQANLTMDHLREVSRECLLKLDDANLLNVEKSNKITELEAENKAMEDRYERALEQLRKTIDNLNDELKNAQKVVKTETSNKEAKSYQAQLMKEIKTFKEQINELTEKNHNQELELLDNAEEIKLFEQEIAAMQQFIRSKGKYKVQRGD